MCREKRFGEKSGKRDFVFMMRVVSTALRSILYDD